MMLNAAMIFGMIVCTGENSKVSLIRLALILLTNTRRSCSIAGPRYHPSTTCGSPVRRYTDGSCTMILVLGGARVVFR